MRIFNPLPGEVGEMRINIIGYGVVGKAQSYLLQRLEHEVFIYDPAVFPSIKRPEKDVDFTFICVPVNAVDEVVHDLLRWDVDGLFIIKSTVPVGTTRRLMQKYGVHIIHNPEFLRERYAFEDVMNPSRIIIGQCCSLHGEKLASIYAPLKKPVYVVDSTTSEAVKLFSNAYLSMLITFWNEVFEFAQKAGLNINEVAELVKADVRVSPYGASIFGKPFEGKCLPSNLDMLIACFENEGLNPLLFEAVKEYNLRLKNASS